MLARVRRILDVNLAKLEHDARNRWVRLGLRNLRIVLHVLSALVRGKHNERAAALTYFSLLSLVPLLAVVFSVFKAFGGLRRVADQLKTYVLDYLAYESQNAVSEWLDRFVRREPAAAAAAEPVGAPVTEAS